ncbi:MAG: hypothetical protein IJE73_03900 [Muribaculaceae bacterium]|nr:hypothetical protein [Muribaculaceae bacterium]
MKFLNKLGIFGLLAFAMSACVDQDPEIQNFPDPDVDFTYEVAGGDSADYKYDYYVVSHIQFNNTSAKTGNVSWDFGAPEGEYEVTNEDINNPIVKYKNAGRYDVTLTIDGVGSRTYPILIYDIVPKMSISEQSMELVELNECKVSFGVRLPNPENKVVRYTWTFPEGAKDADGNPITTFVRESDPETGAVECPQNVTFSNLGSQQVTVDAIFDLGSDEERQLEQSYINVQVASPIEAPTLYYAQVGGNIKAIKLIDESLLPSGTKVLPYDMGVSAGENPFNILYGKATDTNEETGAVSESHWIYILDAGKQYYYINDEAGVLGDGKITAMRVNGTDVNTVISNVGGPAFSDPYQGCIYGDYIYYNDRNRGFSKVKMTDRGLQEGKSTDNFRLSYVATNEFIPQYDQQISYGAISNGLYRSSKGLWWWGKNYSGNGILRFSDKEIFSSKAEADVVTEMLPELLDGLKFTSFAVDESRNALYVWSIGGGKGVGFVEYSIADEDAIKLAPTATPTAVVAMDAKPVNTTADEGVYVKQLVVDQTSGRVYFGFRAEEGDPSGIGTGLVYYDPVTKKCQRYGVTDDEILGVTINPTATKLF